MKSKELNLAIRACLEAGKTIMEVYNSVIEVEYKEDSSPLTEADKRANDIINTFLIPSETPIISEENKQMDYSVRKNWKDCWLVDPLDGTKEFIKRNGEFTVNIAFVKNGIPELGVIYVPAVKTIYYGNVVEGNAFKAELGSHDTTIDEVLKLSKPLQPKLNTSNKIEVVGSRSHMNEDTLNFVEALKKEGNEVTIVSKGSSLKFCLVAEGNADVYPRYAPTMEWDTAAGHAICSAVGVKVISKDNNQPLKYNKENLLNSYFLVSK
jgi:3'(2'), 5'-bisphosphate nucleotidase